MFGFFRVLKSLLITEDSTLTPRSVQITPGGTAGTTTTIVASQTTNKTITLPDATDQLVARNTIDTLTNKTLTAPVIASIVNTGTLTLPAITDTLVARTTTDNLSNKTFVDAVTHNDQVGTPSNPAAGKHKLYFKADGLYQLTDAGVETKFESGTAGTITNLVAPAQASYDVGDGTFVFQENTVGPVAANLDAASILLRNKTPNSTEAVKLSAPDALVDSYEIKLPILPVDSTTTIQNLVLGGGSNPEISFAGTLRGGQSFLSTMTGTFDEFDIGIFLTSATETGNVVLKIYTGFVDTVGPSGLIATSNPIDITTITSSNSVFTTFTFASPVDVTAATTYYALVEGSGYVSGAGPFLSLQTTLNSVYPDGQAIIINDLITQDARFSVDISVEGGTRFLRLTETGEILSDVTVDDSTLEIVGQNVKVKPDGITATEIAPSTITVNELAASLLALLVPPGTINAYTGAAAPTGYLLCDGTSYLRTDYPALFAIIGTKYGAADGTHFNVPDTRGYFLRGWANGASADPDRASRTAAATGGATGDNIGSIQASQVESHLHSITDPGHAHARVTYQGFGTIGAGGRGDGVNGATLEAQYAPSTVTGITGTNTTGGNQTNPNNLYVNYIIKI